MILAAAKLLLSPELLKRLLKWSAALVGLLLALFAFVLSLLASVSASLSGLSEEPPAPARGGPVYQASTAKLIAHTHALQAASIHDLGFGPSDAGRIDRMVACI